MIAHEADSCTPYVQRQEASLRELRAAYRAATVTHACGHAHTYPDSLEASQRAWGLCPECEAQPILALPHLRARGLTRTEWLWLAVCVLGAWALLVVWSCVR